MTYTISKTFEFSAAHQLMGLADNHPCGRLHGHNYVARAEVSADALDGHGFVMDYGDLAPFKGWLDDWLDHRYLNDVIELRGVNPTAEALSKMLRDVLLRVCPVPAGARVRVWVSETPKTWAVYAE